MEDEVDYVAKKKRARLARKEAQKSLSIQVGEGSAPTKRVSEVVDIEEAAWT